MKDKENKNQLFKDWKWEKLADACSFIGGGTPSKKEATYWNGNIFWASVKDIKGTYLNYTEDTITEKGLKNSATNIAEPNDVILVTRINPGKSLITNVKTAINQDLKIVKPKFETSPKFLNYFFKAFERELIKKSSGTTVLGLTLNSLNEIRIPVINIFTQQAIVSKIEELFSELDKGIEQLKTVQQQLKTYRQAVLKWAFEGKLTNENVKEGELPKGWQILKIEEVAECLDSKRKPINKAERLKRAGNVPYYGANGRTGWIDDFLFDESLILVVEDETFVGRELPFSYKITGKSWVNNHAHILKPKENFDLDYLNYQLAYYPFLPLTTGTTGRKKLTKNALMNARLKISPYKEQRQIVSEIESRLSVADKVAETINKSLQQVESLRQSILKRAFEGRLVVKETIEPIKEAFKVIPPEKKIPA